MVCYYLSYIACKLWMQRLSFSLPLILSAPCAILVFLLDKNYNFLHAVTEVTGNDNGGFSDLTSDWKKLVAGGVWFLSLMLLTRYVWFPRQSRLAKFEK